MAAEVIKIPVRGKRQFLGAAAYLAVTAHPSDVQKRDEFIEAAKAIVLRSFPSSFGDRQQWQPWARQIFSIKTDRVNKRISLALLRLSKHRLNAARIALG